MKNKIPKARKNGLVIQELDGETLIYDLNTHRAVCLNQTSALVWQNCDGVKTVSDISSVLTAELRNQANEDLIWLALDQLKKENLIENSDELETESAGVSRREVIKKVGFGTMVALPIISSLVAPRAISAQSAGACGTTCTNNNNCTNPACTRCLGSTGAGGAKTCQA